LESPTKNEIKGKFRRKTVAANLKEEFAQDCLEHLNFLTEDELLSCGRLVFQVFN
jgi:hypothetical protein